MIIKDEGARGTFAQGLKCLDTLGEFDGPIGIWGCHGAGGNQVIFTFMYSYYSEINICLFVCYFWKKLFYAVLFDIIHISI